ncbi:MAG: helix-turn-helix transcriptional regulator, partial [Candidatus Limnocylindrales bacterium]
QRLRRFPAGAISQDVLLLASMLSRPTVTLITAASRDQAAAAAGLGEAEAAGIVEIDDPTVRFTHPLYASVMQARLSQGARRTLHRRLGEALPEGEERAYHLALGATGPDGDLAEQLELAGRQTAHRGAPDLGADLLARSRALTPADRSDDLARRATLEAEARLEAGDLDASRVVLEDAVAWIPPGRQRAEALLLLGTVQWYLERTRASATLEAALLDAADDPAIRGRIHGRLAIFSDDVPTARAHGRAAIALIDHRSDPSGYAFARLSLFFVDVQGGAPPDLEAFEAALALEAGLPGWEVSTIPPLWWKYTGQFGPARDRFDLHLQWARDSGDESSDAELYAHVAELALYAGDWSAAGTAAERAAEAADQMGQLVPHAADRARALGLVSVGRLDEAVTIAEAGIAAAREVDPELEAMYLDVLATARAAALDQPGVIAALDRQVVVLDGLGVREPLRYRTEGDHIEALVATGALDAAQGMIDRLQARHDVIPRPWIAITLARSRALLKEALGDPADAAQDLASFVDAGVSGTGEEPFQIARSHLVLGQLERRLGHRRAAGVRLEAALAVFEALPAPIWVTHARRELDRLGRRRSGVDELTPAEARVVELIAAGLTNKAAAERLVLSPKTVEAHLARTYAKLGIRSRAELGRWMAESRGTAPTEADGPAL